MSEDKVLEQVQGDGGDGPVKDGFVEKLKEEIEQIASDAKSQLWRAKLDGENTRLCRWDGQAPDGLKHEVYVGAEPEPFEGATDLRDRSADMATNEAVAMLTVAALRAEVAFRGVGEEDQRRAAAATKVLRWAIRQMGVEWVENLILWAQYGCGDAPGVGLLKAWWRREYRLRMQSLSADELLAMYMEQFAAAMTEQQPEQADEQRLMEEAQLAAESFRAALADPGTGEEALAEVVQGFFPGVKPGRARKVVRQLRKTGRADFPVRYLAYNGPAVEARRLFDDFYVPLNTRTWQRARAWFEVEWLGATELRERETSMDYRKGWVDEVLKHEGVAAFPEYVSESSEGTLTQRNPDWYRGQYQVVTAYFQATNEDGVPGRYYLTLHKDVDGAAHERRMLDNAHGLWPGHIYRREPLNGRLLDSRGLSEIVGPWQGVLKLLADTFGDHAQISGVPPAVTSGREREGALKIKPLAEIKVKRAGTVEWMKPPQYPQTIDSMLKHLRRDRDEYLGRPTEGTDPTLARMLSEYHVGWWLLNVREALRLIWSDVQQYMTNEDLQRVAGPDGQAVAASMEDIRGNYDLELRFDPATLNIEYVQTVGSVIRDVLVAMDRDKRIDTGPIVASLLWWLSPALAESSLRDQEAARMDEIEDETKQYGKVRAGLEPELPDDGSVNYELRLQFYQQVQQMNPEAFNDLAPDKAKILQSRLQRMQALSQQYGANVQIGREGGKRALGAGAGAPAQMQAGPG